MGDRKKKIEELLESMKSLRRHMPFHGGPLGHMPRITPSQWGALMMIEQSRTSTLKDLAHALGITSSAATQLIDGLVMSGYVLRQVPANDRRTVTLTLSKKTEGKVAAMKKQVRAKFLKLFAVLDDAEFDQYIALNRKIVERLLKK